jgi:hypothetical protein
VAGTIIISPSQLIERQYSMFIVVGVIHESPRLSKIKQKERKTDRPLGRESVNNLILPALLTAS